MKLSNYIAVFVAVAFVAGCSDKGGNVQDPVKGAAATGGTNVVAKTTVTPAPPPPVTTSKPTTSLFPAGGSTAAPAKPAEPVATKPAKPAADAKAATAPATAKVVMVNKEMKFVVLEFSSSSIPVAGSQLSLYRAKERVATIKATEPMKPPLVTADILDGEPRKGDEVR